MLFFGGHSVKRSLVPLNESGVEIITKLQTKCEELGITISKDSKVVELTMTDGRVTGVKTEDGSEYIGAISRDDIDIINEIRHYPNLYTKLIKDVKRYVSLINKKMR